jgi:Tfp pilus assembly protein PilF
MNVHAVRLFSLCLAAGCATQDSLERAEQAGEALRLDLAESYVRKGAYAAAMPLVKRSVEEHPESAHLHVLYAAVLREQGLYPQAEKELLAALEREPQSAAAFAGQGLLYELMRRPDEALAAHRRAVALAPKNAMYWNNFGFSLYVRGRTDGAVYALERALALDPSLVVAYNNLGFAYGRLKDYEGARRAFRSAVGETGAEANMALVYQSNGNRRAEEPARKLARKAEAK